MNRYIALAIAALLSMLLVQPAGSHSMPNSVLIAQKRVRDVQIEAILPWQELRYAVPGLTPVPGAALAAGEQRLLRAYATRTISATSGSNTVAWRTIVDDVSLVQDADHADVRVTLRLIPADGHPPDRFVLVVRAITERVMNHVALVFVGDPGEPDGLRLAGTAQNPDLSVPVDLAAGVGRGFAAAFVSGMRHLAEGADHLLFLITLLLPAPLVAHDGRWDGTRSTRATLRYLLLIATSFTLGHSLTLALGALLEVAFPEQLVEVGIAISILAAALTAWRPLPLGERLSYLIAAGFGLIHGMAFSSLISIRGLPMLDKAVAVAGFNLGVEAMQVIVLLVATPIIVLLSRRSSYRIIRILAASVAGVIAVVLAAQRSGLV